MDAMGEDDVGVTAEKNDWGDVGIEEGADEGGVDEHQENTPEDEYNERKVAEAEASINEDENDGYREKPPYEPKAPPRTPAPAMYKAWLQDVHSSMMTQAVVQDDAEALTWMLRHGLVDLAATDDLGNTAAHLAVFHDSPRVLRLLHELGVDLSATCDAEGFGSAIFYSVYLGRVQCVAELIAVGYDVSRPCDRFKRTPEMIAIRHDQGAALVLVQRSLAALDAQRLTRGFLGRQKAKRIKAAWGKAEARDNKAVVVDDEVGRAIFCDDDDDDDIGVDKLVQGKVQESEQQPVLIVEPEGPDEA